MASKRLREGLARAASAALAAGLLLGATACSIYRNDKCWVDDTRYASMRDVFVQTGSMDLVRSQMDALEWARCEKNEVAYRLSQEFEIPEE